MNAPLTDSELAARLRDDAAFLEGRSVPKFTIERILDAAQRLEALALDKATQEKLRIQMGLQCPECFGVRIENRGLQHGHRGRLCTECGHQWSPPLYGEGVR